MDVFQEIVDWLITLPSVQEAIPLTGTLRDEILGEEGNVGSSSGIPLVNEALEDALSRPYNVALILGKDGEPVPIDWNHSSVLMKDRDGNVVGFGIPLSDRAKYEEDDRYIFLSDDFVMDATADLSEAAMVLPSTGFSLMERNTPAQDVRVMFPSPTTNMKIVASSSEDYPPGTSAFVVSFRL